MNELYKLYKNSSNLHKIDAHIAKRFFAKRITNSDASIGQTSNYFVNKENNHFP